MQEFTARRSGQAPQPIEPQQSQPQPPARVNHGNRQRGRLIAIACAVVAVVCLTASEGMLRGAALLGAGLELPQGAGALLGYTSGRQEAGEAVIAEQIPQAKAPPKANNPKGKDFDMKATPTDIALLMKEADTEFARQERDGDIKAKTYTAKEATHRWDKLTTRNTTKTQPDRDLSKDLAAPLDLKIDKSKPAVLIFHTHTTEAFEIIERPWYAADWNSRTEIGARSIVRVGDAVVQMLERAGYQVIHDTAIYDRTYTGAYDKSRAAIEKWLAENPSIQVTLDVHRDAIHTNNGVRIKPVAQIDGKTAAQVMIISGVEEGNIANYPNWAQNLRFATKLHMAAEEEYPGLMRPLFFCARKYNMDITPFSLLLEMGADVNTLDEAVYSGRLMGEALGRLLDEYAE